MKPTPELVAEWTNVAFDASDAKKDQSIKSQNIAFIRTLAELAAQWGADKAQHEAENAPWLTIAHVICTDAGIAHGPISGRLEALRDKLADAQAAIEEPELPEPIGYLSAHTVEGPFKYQFNKERAAVYPDNAISIDTVFTAAQMHDHFAAVVRVGAAQSQDAKRYRFIRDNIYRLPYDDHGAGPEFDLSEEAIDSAMQGGQQP